MTAEHPDGLGYLLKHALLRLAGLTEAALAPFGIGARELAVLSALDEDGTLSQQQVAHRLDIDRTTMVSLIDALESKGLVARRAHPEDRRRNIVALTESGTDTRHRAGRALDAAEGTFLGPLLQRDARQFRDILRALNNG